jgi:hypothetical protein
VSDLSPAVQAKLLRVIQDLSVERVGGVGARSVDTRIIVATNRPLSELVDRGQFRLDLFYRLNGVDVQVPPLRARAEDIPELARYFLDRHQTLRPLQLSLAAADALTAYAWPGNVRELERVIERGVALAGSDLLEPDDLPPALLAGYADVLLPSVRAKETMRAWGSRYARLVLQRCENNKRRACRELGISYHTLNDGCRPDSGSTLLAVCELVADPRGIAYSLDPYASLLETRGRADLLRRGTCHAHPRRDQARASAEAGAWVQRRCPLVLFVLAAGDLGRCRDPGASLERQP